MGNILGLCAADMIIVGIMDGQYFVGSLVLSYCDYSTAIKYILSILSVSSEYDAC